MKRHITRLLSFRLRACLICTAVVILGFNARPSKMASQSPREIRVRVRSHVENLKVVKFEIKENRVKLTLKNEYAKPITAFAISAGDYTITRDLNHSGNLLHPGGSYVQFATLPSDDESNSEDPVITILAAVFQDRTSEGDATVAEGIKNARRGYKLQTARILIHLRRALDASDENLSTALTEARNAILHLPDGEVGESSYQGIKAGGHHAREEALSDLEELFRLGPRVNRALIRSELNDMKERYSRRAERFSGENK